MCTIMLLMPGQKSSPVSIVPTKERNLDYTSLCADYYKRETLVDAYSVHIMSAGHPNTWVVPVDIRQCVVLPSKSKKNKEQAGTGCPQENRFPSVSERTSTHKCRRCGETKHNSRRCTNTPALPGSSSQLVPDQYHRKCSVCHQVGHNKQPCPDIAFEIKGPSNPK
ncbi:hypothetical protein Dsin_006689 [Dipteronia sinensis]|uniref:CCHC-type domain-containing protein n=1 Tax=Dipteronia sinensis TaxID=43782 RepID=A0AAE0B016_9ROSI|nr:hypothetical protein Dsin_006689 [Dipteronia sinensis]